MLLNDPTYVEAARALAERMIRAGGDTGGRIDFAFRRATGRPARPTELKVLRSLYEQHRAQYQEDAAGAEALLRVGDWPVPHDLPATELAAWTSVARVILNLHETITRD